jgi:hypothetical protein
MPLHAVLVNLQRYDGTVRRHLADAGICETFHDSAPQPDTPTPTTVRVLVPGGRQADAEAALIRALHGRVDYQVISNWHRTTINRATACR